MNYGPQPTENAIIFYSWLNIQPGAACIAVACDVFGRHPAGIPREAGGIHSAAAEGNRADASTAMDAAAAAVAVVERADQVDSAARHSDTLEAAGRNDQQRLQTP